MISQILVVLALLSISYGHPFTVTLKTPALHKLGDEVTCSVSITNDAESGVHLLRRKTPLEDVSSAIFLVTKDGDKVDYDGILFQRAPPSSEEYVYMPAKSSLSSVVDLTQFYPLKSEAQYTVKLESIFEYHASDISNSSLQLVSSNVAAFQMTGSTADHRMTHAERLRNTSSLIKTFTLPLVGHTDASAGYKYAGTPRGSDLSSIAKVYPASYNILIPSYNAVSRQQSLYRTWFGLNYKGYTDTVSGAYLNIKSAMDRYKFTIYFDGPVCFERSNIIAYTYHGATTIYLCNLYRSEPDLKGYNTKVGTIVHEFTHAVAYTEDITYGTTNCKNLAIKDPTQAIRNADNYHYFSEALL